MTAIQTELDVAVPPRLFGVTPSRLTSWLDCPRRYRFGYVDRPTPPKGPPWAHNSVGAAVHNALAGWWSLPQPRRTPAAAAHLVRSRWQSLGFRNDEHAMQWRERAAAMVERYAETLDPADEPVGVERTVAMTTDRLSVSGRIDRLDRRGDELVVVDYKTGRHVLSTDDARGSLALAIYAMAAARTLRRRCVAVELHHLPSGEVIRWQHDEASLARHLDRAHDIAAEALAAEQAAAARPAITLTEPASVADSVADSVTDDELFPARPGPLCGWCDFVAQCPVGREAAGRRLMPWAGLPPDIVSTVDDVLE